MILAVVNAIYAIAKEAWKKIQDFICSRERDEMWQMYMKWIIYENRSYTLSREHMNL